MTERRRVVVFLQNAWSPLYAGGTWPRESWLRAFYASRSGQRLSVLAETCEPSVELIYDNTTPIVGATPHSVVPADLAHMIGVLKAHYPHHVVVCGVHARRAIEKLYAGLLPSQQPPLLIVPHPASRVLTTVLYRQAGQLLRDGFTGRIELVQQRGQVKVWTAPTELTQ